MKFRLFLCLIASVLFFSSPVEAAGEWISLCGNKIQAIGNVDEKRLRREVARFKSLQSSFHARFPIESSSNKLPFKIFVFAPGGELKDLIVTNTSLNQVEIGKNFYVFALAAAEDKDNVSNLSPAHREFLTLLAARHFGANAAPWLQIGATEFVLANEFGDSKIAAQNFSNMLTTENFIPLESFFNLNSFALYNQGEQSGNVFRAQALAVMNYFQQTAARRAEFAKFLKALENDQAPREAFKTAFQKDLGAIEKEIKTQLGKSLTSDFALAKQDAPENYQSVRLAAAEVEAEIGELLRRSNRFDEAAARLQKSLNLKETAFARGALGATQIAQRKFAAARENIEKALALDNENFLHHFYYAQVLSREDANGEIKAHTPEKLEKIRRALDRALALGPDFPESLYLLAQIISVNNQNLNEAVELLEKAEGLAPENQLFALEIANIRLRQTEYDEAKTRAEQIFATTVDPNLRRSAQAVVISVRQIKEELKRINNIRPSAQNSAPARELTEEEALIEAFNEALRKPAADEQRVLGYLTRIDCDAKGMIFVLRSHETNSQQTLRFRTAEFKKVRMTAFVAGVEGQNVSCGARKSEDFVVLTYRPATTSDAELVALEFVPKYFRFL